MMLLRLDCNFMIYKLFIDDIRNAPDDTWMVARTVSSAIEALTKFEFAAISFDHDISHQIAMGSVSRPFMCDETFEPVARFLALQVKLEALQGKSVPIVVIHSSNPSGAAKMQAILQEVGINAPYLPHKNGAANRLEMIV